MARWRPTHQSRLRYPPLLELNRRWTSNLAPFDLLERVSLAGLWSHCKAAHATLQEGAEEPEEVEEREEVEALFQERDRFLGTAIAMVNSNSALQSPIRDDFAIETALVMLLAQVCGRVEAVGPYVRSVAVRVMSSVVRGGAYPIAAVEYHELVGHRVESSDGASRSSRPVLPEGVAHSRRKCGRER